MPSLVSRTSHLEAIARAVAFDAACRRSGEMGADDEDGLIGPILHQRAVPLNIPFSLLRGMFARSLRMPSRTT